MKTKHKRELDESKAFTRLELLATIIALALPGLVVLPSLAGLNTNSDRAACANNLRLIGRGIHMWSGDHEGRVPWWTPISEGGTMPASPIPGNAWTEYFWLSNHLVTPKILACPSDLTVNRADTWSEFRNLGFRNAASSYHVSLHATAEDARSWLSSDWNFRASGTFNGCSSRKTGGRQINHGSLALAWTNGVVHGDLGHLLMNDGGVEFTTSSRLRELIYGPVNGNDNDIHHFLPVR